MVDASGMVVRLHADKEEWQVFMESAEHKSGRLERTSAWNGQEMYLKNRGKMGENGP